MNVNQQEDVATESDLGKLPKIVFIRKRCRYEWYQWEKGAHPKHRIR